MRSTEALCRAIALAGLILFGIGASRAVGQCEVAKLTASDAAERDAFGSSVGISGDYLVVGAPSIDISEGEPGAAYVFRRDGSTWVEQVKLTPSDPQPFARFGGSVSISGDAIVVGAPGAEHAGIDSGAVYVFRRDGLTWVQEAKLASSVGCEGLRGHRPVIK